MTTLKSNLHAEFGWTWQDQDGSTMTTNTNRLRTFRDLLEGSGINQANQVWDRTEATLAAGNTLTLDLTSLARDFFGESITLSFNTIKGILIVNRNTIGTASLKIGNAAADTWYAPFGASSHTVSVPTDGNLLLCNPGAGWAVTSSAKSIKLEAVGGEVTYDIVLLGVATS